MKKLNKKPYKKYVNLNLKLKQQVLRLKIKLRKSLLKQYKNEEETKIEEQPAPVKVDKLTHC